LRLAGTASTGAAIFLLTGHPRRLLAQSTQGDLGILTAGVLKSLGVEPNGPEKYYDFGPLKTEKDILRLARDRLRPQRG